MPNLIKTTDDASYRARADRSIQSGLVISVNTVDHTAILDVGMVDNDGNPVFMVDVPFTPQSPPHVQDTVAIMRTNSSPYSHVIGGGAQVGGANTGSGSSGSGPIVSSGGAVTTLSKSGSTKLQGDVTLTGSGGVTLTQVGQNIDIAASGATTGPTWDLLTTGDVAVPELVFAAGNVIWVPSP